MRNIFSFRYFGAAMLAVFILSGAAFAQGADKKEVKFKFSTLSQEARDKIETITSLLKGVSESNVKKDNKTLVVKYDENQISSDMLRYAIETIGYRVDSVEEVTSTSADDGKTESKAETDKSRDDRG